MQENSFLTRHSAHLNAIANEDGAAILDAQSGTISTLNSSGAFVWQALERGEAVENIVANIARETTEKLETVRKDVLAFINALESNHLMPGR